MSIVSSLKELEALLKLYEIAEPMTIGEISELCGYGKQTGKFYGSSEFATALHEQKFLQVKDEKRINGRLHTLYIPNTRRLDIFFLNEYLTKVLWKRALKYAISPPKL